MCIAVGNVSLLDWPMFTWSLGWTGCWEPSVPPTSWMHRLEMTSFTFMLDCVPDPVDQLALPRGQAARPGVHPRRRLLHVPVGVIYLLRHPVVADIEMLQAA